jgi:hypothetical protein
MPLIQQLVEPLLELVVRRANYVVKILNLFEIVAVAVEGKNIHELIARVKHKH